MPETPPPATSTPTASQEDPGEQLDQAGKVIEMGPRGVAQPPCAIPLQVASTEDTMAGRLDLLGDLAGNTYDGQTGALIPKGSR